MKILITTDNHIVMNRERSQAVESEIDGAIERFERHLTSLDVHLADENADKGGDRKIKCVIDAHIEGMKTVTVTEYASTVDEAITGATEEMKRLLEATFSKLDEKRTRKERSADRLVD
jgi:ribosome-associated translation inhibitor RaiA